MTNSDLDTTALLVRASYTFMSCTASAAVMISGTALAVGMLLVATYVYTWLCYFRQKQLQGSRNPVTPPYFIPYFGHSFQFLTNPEKYIRSLWFKLRGAPFYLTFPRSQVYMAMPGEQVQWLFSPKNCHLTPTPSLSDALITFFGLPEEDQKLFRDSSQANATGDRSRYFMTPQRRDFSIFLQGSNLRLVMERFLNNFKQELGQPRPDNIGWRALPDLYSYMITRIFRAEVKALYGEHIFQICPTLCEDFWTFYDAVPTLAKKLPKWFSPSSYVAQRQMQTNFLRWRAWYNEHFDWNDNDLCCAEYDSVWGTRYIRQMAIRHEALGFSDVGVATAMLGYLFVTVANSTPIAVWMMLHIIIDKDLTDRVQSEIASTFDYQSNNIKLDKLMKLPLFNSIYRETLRLHAASAVGRTPTLESELPGGWKIKPDVPIMTTNWLGGLDMSFWNTGRVLPDRTPEHPLDGFWAERFLEFSDDPLSGPIRKEQTHMPLPAERPERKDSQDRVVKLVTTGLQGHFFPFGGGTSRCPGESLAKQTILGSVATVLHAFTIELRDPVRAAETKSSHKNLPFGSHAFDRLVPIKIRERSLD